MTFGVSIGHGRRASRNEWQRGGDFFSCEEAAGARPMLVLGDVALKSLAGDLLAAALRLTFRRIAVDTRAPSEVLSRLNATLLRRNGMMPPSEMFASVFAATIDPVHGTLTYAAAGVEGAMLFRGAGEHEHLGATGPLLGLQQHANFADRTLTFSLGDVLVAYSDGVTEARSWRTGEFLGTSGLTRCMRRLLDAGMAPTCMSLLQELDDFTGGMYRDDTTVALALATSRRSDELRRAGSRPDRPGAQARIAARR